MKKLRLAGSTRRSSVRALVLASCVLFAFPALEVRAQLSDPIHTAINVITQGITRVTEGWEYGEELKRWRRKAQEIQDSLTKLQNLMDMRVKPTAFDMTLRDDPFYGVEEACPGAANNFSVGGLIDRIAPKVGVSLAEQQQEICVKIVYAQNMKYNETVKLFKANDAYRRKIGDLQIGGDSKGELNSYMANLDALVAAATSENKAHSGVISGYDAMIASLRKDKSLIAKQALRGARAPLGAVFKGAVLRTALKINESK